MISLKKTNVMRLLDAASVEYRIFEYSIEDGKLDAVSMAEKIGLEHERVFKTLVTESPDHEHFVFIIPGNCELDLKKAAKVSGQKKIEMIPAKTLLPLTGYIHGGCSPFGMKKPFRTFLDETAVLWDFICVSGGKIGFSVGLDPETLVKLVPAEYADLTSEKIPEK